VDVINFNELINKKNFAATNVL